MPTMGEMRKDLVESSGTRYHTWLELEKRKEEGRELEGML